MSERPLTPEERLKAAEGPLLAWYGSRARALPWREEPSPYRVWISEIMLQQTRVEAVKPYFQRFLQVFPDVETLAGAEEELLMKQWEGLGYYSRARNLQAAAKKIMEEYGGEIPDSRDELLTLPGIGSYTAGAIASIAYGVPEPAVDGNVLRVISRLLGERWDITKAAVKKQVEELVAGVMPAREASSYNQSLIETGALVCVPGGEPHCAECPLEALCMTRKEGLWKEIPYKPPKKPRRIEERTLFLIEWEGKTAIAKRPDTGLLASMYELPGCEGFLSREEAAKWLGAPEKAEALEELPRAKHIFSHVEWHMIAYRLRLSSEGEIRLPEGAFLAKEEELRSVYPLPGAFQAYRNG